MVFKARVNWKEELPTIKELGSLGWNLSQLAEKYGVTRQRMKQVTAKFIPEWQKNYGPVIYRKKLVDACFAERGVEVDIDLYDAQRQKFRAKKSIACRTGYSWELSFGDLRWPSHCPILGLELDYFAESRQENSPSFDRIDSNLGYVAGNVEIVSWRANRIKNNGTAEEHLKIAKFLTEFPHGYS